MRDKKDGSSTTLGQALHALYALTHEVGVACAENLVDDQDLGLNRRRHREREANTCLRSIRARACR